MGDIEFGPISTILVLIGLNLAPLESIPILGIPFILFDFMLGFFAGLLSTFGLK